MLNARDTLQRIAEALNIAAEPQEKTEVQPEAVEPTKELIEEPIAEVVEEVKTEVEEPKAEPQIETEAEPKEEVKDDRVQNSNNL